MEGALGTPASCGETVGAKMTKRRKVQALCFALRRARIDLTDREIGEIVGLDRSTVCQYRNETTDAPEKNFRAPSMINFDSWRAAA